MKDIEDVEVGRLISHERVDKERLEKLLVQVRKDKKLKKPIVVDRETMMILDGHHRYKAFLILGMKFIPCYLVDYMDDRIKVNFRREDIKNRLVKEIIIRYIKEGKIFPYKTTKHLLPRRPIINRRLMI